jgi:hypothetical protein
VARPPHGSKGFVCFVFCFFVLFFFSTLFSIAFSNLPKAPTPTNYRTSWLLLILQSPSIPRPIILSSKPHEPIVIKIPTRSPEYLHEEIGWSTPVQDSSSHGSHARAQNRDTPSLRPPLWHLGMTVATPIFYFYFVFFYFLFLNIFVKKIKKIKLNSHIIIDKVTTYVKCQIFIHPHKLSLNQITVNLPKN